MSVDLGTTRILGAEAVGQPGQRRFRLYAQGTHGSIVMWMEKEQLNSLSLALDRALAQLTEGQVLRIEASREQSRSTSSMPGDFPHYPTHEFQVGQLTLAYDNSNDEFVLSAVPLEVFLERGPDPDLEALTDEDAVLFRFNQEQARQLSSTIVDIVRAGRPTCPYCGMPLDDGPHSCVKQNGHKEIIQVEASDDENDEE